MDSLVDTPPENCSKMYPYFRFRRNVASCALFINDLHENVTNLNTNSLEKVWNNRKIYMCVFAIFLSIIIQIQFKQSAEKPFPYQPSRTSEHAVWKLLSSSKDTDEQCCLLWVCSEQFLLLCLAQYIHHVQHQHYLQHWISLVKDKQIKRNRRQRMKLHMSEFSGPWMTLLYESFPFSVHRAPTLICWHKLFKLKPID